MPTAQQLLDKITANGMTVDIPAAMRAKNKLADEELELRDKIDELTGYHELRKSHPDFFTKKDDHFNPRSSKHLTAWCKANEVDVPNSFAVAVLERIMPPDISDALIASRKCRKAQGDLQTLRNHTALDGKLHPKFVPAKTGRWYTGNPNIQTMGKICRRFITPEPGNVFFVVDWEQQELRFIAHVSGETALLEAFQKGDDPHWVTFERMFEKGRDSFSDPESAAAARNIGKTLNYALVYGQDENGLANSLRITADRAKALIERHWAAFPKIRAWAQEQIAKVREQGFVETLGGRRMELDASLPQHKLDRMAVNYFAQGTGGDQLVQTLATCDEFNLMQYVRCVMHDALLIEAPEHHAPFIAQSIRKIMELGYQGVDTPAETKGPQQTWAAVMDQADEELIAA